MGKSIAPGLVEVVDEDGKPLPAGVVGDIAVHLSMPALFHTYYKDPGRKESSTHGEFFITGDRAKKMKMVISGSRAVGMTLSLAQVTLSVLSR